jgi:hypothetical protein
MLADELATNPFLRPGDPEIRAAVGAAPGDPDWRVFGAVRARKNGWGGAAMIAVYPLYDRLPLRLGRLLATIF